MADLTFEWDSRDLEVWRSRRVEQALVRALTKAGNDAARAMKAAGGRSVRQRKRMKVARVNRALPLTFPRGKQDLHSLVWRMDVSGEPIPLSAFPYRQTRRGVTVSVNNGARKLVRSAFVATLASGHVGIFRRRGKDRLPIDEAFTTRVSDVFRDEGMIPAVYRRASLVFSSAFARLLPLELGKVQA
jgi:hypothetical protein